MNARAPLCLMYSARGKILGRNCRHCPVLRRSAALYQTAHRPTAARAIGDTDYCSSSGMRVSTLPSMRDVMEICEVIFGLCVMLFHLANAALLPLVGQELAAW